MKTVSRDSWDEVTDSPVPTLVYFGANWCPACRALKPTLDALEGESNGRYAMYSADLDSLQREHRIRNYPTCLVFKQGVETARIVGVERKSVYLDVLSDKALRASPIEGEKDMASKKSATKEVSKANPPKGALDWMNLLMSVVLQVILALKEEFGPKMNTVADSPETASCENCAAELEELIKRQQAVLAKLNAGTCDHSCCEEMACIQACLLALTCKMHCCIE